LRRFGGGFVDQAGGEIGVDRHLLAGHGVEVEARRDFGDAARALGDDDEVHDHQDANTMMPMTKLPRITKLPKASMTWPAAAVPSWPFGQDQARRGEVQRSRSMVAISSTVGKDEKFERRLDEQRRHQDQHREDDRDASSMSSSSGGSGRIRHRTGLNATAVLR
jgi:hypothetical protein